MLRGTASPAAKRSTYNLTSATDDGRHDRLTADAFRNIISKTVAKMKLDEQENEKERNKSLVQTSIVNKKYLLVEQSIYRCGWCGNIVDLNGNELNDHDNDYNIAVLNKFGSKLTVHVDGYCCNGEK